MPVSGSYEWLEKSDQVKISVPLRGVSPSSVDIFVTSSALKINYPPYLIDLVLRNSVDSVKHKAVIKNGVLVVTLFKTEHIHWGELEAPSAIKEEMRETGRKIHEDLEKELQTKRRERKSEDERFSVKRQMALDQSYRERIENLKAEEKREAEEEVYAVLESIQSTKETSPPPPQAISTDIFDLSDLRLVDEEVEEEEVDEEIRRGTQPSIVEYLPEVADDKTIPPPRSQFSSNRFEIGFTPRVFPTPLRESKASEEGDWIAKNRKHLRRHGALAKHIPKGVFPRFYNNLH